MTISKIQRNLLTTGSGTRDQFRAALVEHLLLLAQPAVPQKNISKWISDSGTDAPQQPKILVGDPIVLMVTTHLLPFPCVLRV
jgi:hypothetical protein